MARVCLGTALIWRGTLHWRRRSFFSGGRRAIHVVCGEGRDAGGRLSVDSVGSVGRDELGRRVLMAARTSWCAVLACPAPGSTANFPATDGTRPEPRSRQPGGKLTITPATHASHTHDTHPTVACLLCRALPAFFRFFFSSTGHPPACRRRAPPSTSALRRRNPPFVPTPACDSPPPPCVRASWLALATATVPLKLSTADSPCLTCTWSWLPAARHGQQCRPLHGRIPQWLLALSLPNHQPPPAALSDPPDHRLQPQSPPSPLRHHRRLL